MSSSGGPVCSFLGYLKSLLTGAGAETMQVLGSRSLSFGFPSILCFMTVATGTRRTTIGAWRPMREPLISRFQVS